MLGRNSGGLVNVDHDCPEARSIAGRFLQPTRTSGRATSPHCHWWYLSEGTESQTYKDLEGKTVLELRGDGRQTCLPPSVHPDDREAYVWHRETGLEVVRVESAELLHQVRLLASVTLIARHLPPVGRRHDFALALAGFLLRRLDQEEVRAIMLAAWHTAGGASRDAVRDIEGIVRDTAERLDNGEEVVGGTTLNELVRGLPKRLSRYWGWRSTREKQQHEVPNRPNNPYGGNGVDWVDKLPPLEDKRFRDLGHPGEREYVVERLIPAKSHIGIYGDGGSAKSILIQSLLQNIARGTSSWLGVAIPRARACLYIDFELDEEEQARRGLQVARGDGHDSMPDGYYYLCGAARPVGMVFDVAFRACEKHGIEVVAIDSVGLALDGDPGRASDVTRFFSTGLDRFRIQLSVATILVDHQAKSASGESYQTKTMYGSAYKGNLVRSRIQVEREKGGEPGTRSVILRQNKANFSAEAEPFKVKLTFSEERIGIEREELAPEELAGEHTLNLRDRVLLALADGSRYPASLADALGATTDVVGNAVRSLRKEGKVERTSEHEGNSWEVAITDEGRRHVAGYLSLGEGDPRKPTTQPTPHTPKGRGVDWVPTETKALQALQGGYAPGQVLREYRESLADLERLSLSVAHYWEPQNSYYGASDWREPVEMALDTLKKEVTLGASEGTDTDGSTA